MLCRYGYGQQLFWFFSLLLASAKRPPDFRQDGPVLFFSRRYARWFATAMLLLRLDPEDLPPPRAQMHQLTKLLCQTQSSGWLTRVPSERGLIWMSVW